MSHVKHFDHVGITVRDLDHAIDFFIRLGLEVETRIPIEGEFLDTVTGLSGARTEIAMLHAPDGGSKLELSTFEHPELLPGSPAPMANELGIRNVAFEVDDLDLIIDRLKGEGHGLIGGIGEWEGTWRMAYVRGPEGIIVELAQRIGRI